MSNNRVFSALLVKLAQQTDVPPPVGRDVPYKPDLRPGSLFTSWDVERGYVPKTVRGPFYDPTYAYYHAGIFPPGMGADPTRLSLQLGGLGGALGLAHATWRRSRGENPSLWGQTGVGMLSGGVLGYVLAKLINNMRAKRQQMGITEMDKGVFAPARWTYEPPSPMNIPMAYGNLPQAIWGSVPSMIKRQSVKQAQVLPLLSASFAPTSLYSGVQNLGAARQDVGNPEARLGHTLAGAGGLLFGLASLSPWGRGLRTLAAMSRLGRAGKLFKPKATVSPWGWLVNKLGGNAAPRVSGAAERMTRLKNWGINRGFRLNPETEQRFLDWGTNMSRVGSRFSGPWSMTGGIALPTIGNAMVAGNARWQDRMARLQSELNPQETQGV